MINCTILLSLGHIYFVTYIIYTEPFNHSQPQVIIFILQGIDISLFVYTTGSVKMNKKLKN